MIIREINESDINLLGCITDDLYTVFQKNYTDQIFVIEKPDNKIFIAYNNDSLYIYKYSFIENKYQFEKQVVNYKDQKVQSINDKNKNIEIQEDAVLLNDYVNNIIQILGYEITENFYGYNSGIFYRYNNLNSKIIYNIAFPYRLNINNPYIVKQWLQKPTFIQQKKSKISTRFEYCTENTNPLIYDYQNRKYNFINMFEDEELFSFPEGFYIRSLYKFGKVYSYEDIYNILKYIPYPSDQIIEIFNNQNTEVNYLNLLYTSLMDYKINRSSDYGRVYFKK